MRWDDVYECPVCRTPATVVRVSMANANGTIVTEVGLSCSHTGAGRW
jgi:hypothetical protein